jgi:PAS domain-containing protein
VFRGVRDTGEAVFYKDKPFVFPDQPERRVTYWDWSLTPARDTSGKLTGLVFSLRETTPFKEAQDKLRSSEQRHRSLFEAMSEGFALHEIICDAEGTPCDYRFLEVNPAFERLTGLKRRDLVGKRVKEILPGTEAHWIDSFG